MFSTFRATAALAVLSTIGLPALGGPKTSPPPQPPASPAYTAPQSPAPAAPPPAVHPPDPTNAALLYWRYWSLVAPAQTEELTAVYRAMTDRDDWRPDADVIALLRDLEFVSQGLVRAGQLQTADFGLEYAEGVRLLTPHIGEMRSGARLLLLATRRERLEGRLDAAARYAGALLASAAHLRSDGLVISSVTSAAIASLALDELGRIFDEADAASRPLRPATLASLRAQIARFDGPDPFHIALALRGGELRVAAASIRDVARSGLVAADGNPDDEARADSVIEIADLAAAGPLFADLATAWEADDRADRIGAVQERIDAGEYGVMARMFAPALGRFAATTERVGAQVAATARRIAEAP